MSPPPPPHFSNSSTLTRRFGVSSEIFESSRVDRPRREKSKIVGLGESKAEGGRGGSPPPSIIVAPMAAAAVADGPTGTEFSRVAVNSRKIR